MQKAETGHNIARIRVCRAAPKVSHLFFADDTLIFSKANMRECEEILGIFNKYGQASGQKINFDKSFILFSSNVSQQTQNQILEWFDINSIVFSEKYLGLPFMVGRSKNYFF